MNNKIIAITLSKWSGIRDDSNLAARMIITVYTVDTQKIVLTGGWALKY